MVRAPRCDNLLPSLTDSLFAQVHIPTTGTSAVLARLECSELTTQGREYDSKEGHLRMYFKRTVRSSIVSILTSKLYSYRFVLVFVYHSL